MANTFGRILTQGTSAGSVIATIPANTQWVIIGLMASNVAGYLITIDVTIAGTSLVKNVPIPEGSTLPLLEGKIVLNEGDTINELCSVDAGVDYIISYMEMT